MNNPKRILKINSIYKSIKKNKLLWDKFNHERKRRLHWKPTKHYFKKLKGTWTNGKTLHVHGLKDLMLLRWRYYIEEAIDPVPSLSKSLWCVLFVCFAIVVIVVYQNRKTHPKNPTQLTFVPAVSPARHALTPVSPASERMSPSVTCHLSSRGGPPSPPLHSRSLIICLIFLHCSEYHLPKLCILLIYFLTSVSEYQWYKVMDSCLFVHYMLSIKNMSGMW